MYIPVNLNITATILTQMEIMGERGELDPPVHNKSASVPSHESVVELVNTLHNSCQVGLLSAKIETLAAQIPLIATIWKNNNHCSPSQGMTNVLLVLLSPLM
jgi:hypothetical protein